MRGIGVFGLFVLTGFVSSAALAAPQTAPQAPSDARQVLPITLVPSHYDLSLRPSADSLTFKGVVRIEGEARTSGSQIVLNAKGLMFDEVRLDGGAAATVALDDKLGRATLTFPASYTPGHHSLSIAYHGPITKATLGFFAMDYDSPAGNRRTLATNFEPAEARRLLPCWDEPAIKATFTVTVDAPADRMVVSNMPAADTTPLGGGLKRVRFAESPKMSTYLLFLGIGDFERVHQMVDGVDVGIVVKRGDLTKTAYALEQAVALLHYYNTYFGVPYALPKLDLVAAPGEITGGSMENWGAIFYSQDHVLFDPRSSTEAERQLVFQVVSHEMAHQWFGNLVTMAWWDNLWLNEGFARWMQTHAADALHPEWETGLQAMNIFESGKRQDAKAATHPVLQPVASAEQATQAFDAITYNKGAAVITMLEAYVGANAFRDGVRRYMQAHAFNNTIDDDLWREIQAVAGKPVLDIEHDFTRQPGVPMVRVAPAKTGSSLTEGRFAEDPASLTAIPETLWRIPLSVGSPGSAPSTVLLSHSVPVSGAAPLVNAGGTAYARVAYPQAVAEALAERMPTLPASDQINLMNDAWALGQSGYSPAANVMAFISRLPADANPLVWSRALGVLVTIEHAYGENPKRSAFRREALHLLQPLDQRLGVTPTPTESANLTTLRSNAWRARARFGDSPALERARRIVADGKGAIEDQRAALDIVGQAADARAFDMLLARARATQDPQDKMRLLRAMSGAADQELSNRMVDIACGPDTPAGSAAELIFIAGRANPDAVWQALQPHLANGSLRVDQQTRWYLIPDVAAGSADSTRIADVRRYGVQDMPADARRPIEEAVSSIELNARVRATALPDIDRWIASRTP